MRESGHAAIIADMQNRAAAALGRHAADCNRWGLSLEMEEALDMAKRLRIDALRSGLLVEAGGLVGELD